MGTFVARCTLLRVTKRFVGSAAICDGVYNLRDGTITAAAYLTFSNNPTTTFAVTGGTGAYDGARGTGTTTDRPGNNNPLSETVITSSRSEWLTVVARRWRIQILRKRASANE